MRDKTYQIFQRCYLVTLGIVISALSASYLLVQYYVTVSPIERWEWVFASFAAVLSLVFAGVGIFGKPSHLRAWIDPFKTGDLFEFLVIGIAFPLYSIVWLFRKILFIR